ncbi:methionyl aminopeptidase [Clostridium cellulovorans]|uniref:Methionine aminopeptidase n=1 Tax=Clostridium cellulovorans (strain ATCC 35296 / DSM 3052 / OCM 3 / 743B) TaxID=573061 RepID=D9SVB2_CLOC7|nr:methionyl aminopeptidase [Clostridium cellulovorans]ADL51036.1 methionine aminopeptidase, type I [Clostridium cellulovorans 743B]
MKLNRNDECWCGSGKKYKKCHIDMDLKLEEMEKVGYEIPPRNIIKTPEQIEGMRKSAKITTGILDLVEEKIKEGMSTEEIDILVYNYTIEHGGIPADLNYDGYPKSVCVSRNDIVCHGIPNKEEKLLNGDIVNVDVSTILDGYYSDASRMYLIGEVSEEAQRLVRVSKECLYKGIEAVKPYNTLGDMANAIQSHAEANGYSVVVEFGGHGIGLGFHEDPFVPHVGKPGEGMVMVPGMTFTIEPMINQGAPDIAILDDEWTVVTDDGSLTAQWEHTVLVTETGVEILT